MPDNYFYFRETILLLTQTKPGVIKPFPRSTQPSTTFIMLKNVKMPTIVGSLTLIIMINTSLDSARAKEVFEPRSVKTSLNDKVVKIKIITHTKSTKPANFMRLSPLFMKIWSFETIHCLSFNTQRQKLYDVTNNVNVNFLIYRFAGCMKYVLFLANILFLLYLACVLWNSQKS